MRAISSAIFAAAVIVAASTSAWASPIYGTAVDPNDADPNNDFTGSRVYHDEGAAGEAIISWEITQSGGEFTYRYTFTIPGGGPTFKDVSHFTLDLSNDFGLSDETDLRSSFSSNSDDGFDPNDPEDIEFGDNDGLTGAVKFDFGGGKDGNTSDGELLYYEFTVKRSPVWGNLGVKAGTPLHQNAGLGNEGVSMDPDDFIAVPNGLEEGPMIPEPAGLTLALLIISVGMLTRRRDRA